MGWSSGGNIMEGIIHCLSKEIKDSKQRARIYKSIIKILENSDWDTQEESLNIDDAYDQALREVHPNWDI
jgi:hypothetical protein